MKKSIRKRTRKRDQIFVGTFDLGHEEVDLYVKTKDTGGEFYFIPERGRRARIKVGVATKYWPQVVGVLMHEAVEFAMTRQNHRFSPCGKFNGDSAWYTFIMTHDAFGHVIACASDFVTPAIPKLKKLWQKHRTK